MNQADISWEGWFAAQLEWSGRPFVKDVWLSGLAANKACAWFSICLGCLVGEDIHAHAAFLAPVTPDGKSSALQDLIFFFNVLFLVKYSRSAICVSSSCLASARESRSLVSNSFRLHGLWDSPGQYTGVGDLSLLQGIFPTQGSNPGPPALRAASLPAEPPGKPHRCIY